MSDDLKVVASFYDVGFVQISRGDTYTVSDDEGGLYKVPTNIVSLP